MALISAGLAYEEEPGAGGYYFAYADILNHSNEDYRLGAPLSEAMQALDTVLLHGGRAGWGATLWHRAGNGDSHSLSISISRACAWEEDPDRSKFHGVTLSGALWQFEDDRLESQAFLAWMRLLSELIHPWFGHAGVDYGGEFGLVGKTTPITNEVLAEHRLPRIENLNWMTLFGPPYVERLGHDRLLSAPAWRSDLLADGAVAIALAPHPDSTTLLQPLELAAHLGIALLPLPDMMALLEFAVQMQAADADVDYWYPEELYQLLLRQPHTESERAMILSGYATFLEQARHMRQ